MKVHVMRSVVIEAPVATVWQTIRCFDGVAAWNPGVTAVRMERGAPTEVGAIRALDTADGGCFRETLLAHSDLDYSYTYDIIESPLPCQNYVATHRLVEITEGDRTLGIWEGDFECAESDAQTLSEIVGERIYRDGQIGLNQYIKENRT